MKETYWTAKAECGQQPAFNDQIVVYSVDDKFPVNSATEEARNGRDLNFSFSSIQSISKDEYDAFEKSRKTKERAKAKEIYIAEE